MMSRTVVLGMLRRRAISAIDKPQTRLMDLMKHTSHSSSFVDPLMLPIRALPDDEREGAEGETEGDEVDASDPVASNSGDDKADEGGDP